MTSPLDGVHEQAKKMVETLVAGGMLAAVHERDSEEAFPWGNLGLLRRQGLMGLLTPPSYGGAGSDAYTFLATVEAVAKACPATALAYTTHIASSLAILANGSDEQRGRYLSALADGEVLCALAATEAGGGSNPFTIQTSARQESDAYILNGSKLFISGAGEAQLYLVLARTDRRPGPGAFSAFLVEKGNPGLSFGAREDKMGLRALPTAELIFQACRVRSDSRLGPEGAGFDVLGVAGGLAALGAAAMALGLAQAAVDATRQYLLQRTILDEKLGRNPVVQLRFADMLTELNAARALVMRAAHDRENGPPGPAPTVLQAKTYATEKALRIIDDAIQLHGAYGYTRELPLEQYYRDARALTIHFGTNDGLKTMMSQFVLGLPPG